MENKRRVLVTGSSGFIGQTLCRYLRGLNYHVVGLDIDLPESEDGPDEFIECDLLDAEGLKKAITEAKCPDLIHLAATTELREDYEEWQYAANKEGVANLVEGVVAAGCVERCIYTSTQLVCELGHVPNSDTEFRATSKYGVSKVHTEKIVRKMDGGGCLWCIARPTTIWGPGMSAHYLRLFRLMKKGLYVHFGKRDAHKSYGFVGNTVYQYEKVLRGLNEQTQGKVLYFADYETLSLRYWLDGIQARIDGPAIRTVPLGMGIAAAKVGDTLVKLGMAGFPFTSFRLNNILTEYQFDMSEMEKLCGELPFDIDYGIEQMGRWLRETID